MWFWWVVRVLLVLFYCVRLLCVVGVMSVWVFCFSVDAVLDANVICLIWWIVFSWLA